MPTSSPISAPRQRHNATNTGANGRSRSAQAMQRASYDMSDLQASVRAAAERKQAKEEAERAPIKDAAFKARAGMSRLGHDMGEVQWIQKLECFGSRCNACDQALYVKAAELPAAYYLGVRNIPAPFNCPLTEDQGEPVEPHNEYSYPTRGMEG